MSQFIEMFGDQNTNDKGWSESLVKDEFKLSMGKTPARNNPECWDNGNHKWVSISDMSSYARYTGDTSEYITDYAIADSGIKPVPKGTIIMSFKLSIGRTAITSEDIYTNEAIMAFADFDEKKFNIDFLHFLIANKNWLLGAKQAVKGQTLNKESIGNAKIIIPPIEMQEQFASIYNQADKSEFVGFKSQFIEMFGDQNTNDKGWSESLVKDEFKLSMGKTPARNNPECWDNGNHKWVSISDMSSYARYTGDTSEYITDYAIADSGIKPVPKGTIIMSFKLSIGRTAITSEDIYTNEAIMAFADFDEKKFNIDFLHFLIANKNWLLGAKQAVKGQTLNKESIGNAKIIIPPIEMQEQFASIYNQADKSEFVGFKSQFIEMFGNPLSSIQKNELKKLGDCCQINPRRPSVSISDSDLVSFVPMPAVNEDGYIDGATNEEYGKVKKGFTYFENNDVLFAKITPCMENGKGAIAEALTNGIGMGSTEFHVLRPIEGISNPYWLLTLTRMPIFRECAAKNMSGTGGQRRVGAAFLENFMIGLPSISEQETFETIYRQADKSEYYN